ncbi:hypothetical protein BGZ76_006870 [Entomortierella beljakovae]|nr:hypothetical protein BGZ76_006870 [Entomortierella beljakovae]
MANQLRELVNAPNLILFTKIITVSSMGIYAGSAYNYNAVIMPSLRKFASTFQIANIAVSVMGASILYFRTKDTYYLLGALLMASMLPYNKTLVYPINKKLLDIRKHGGNDSKVEEILAKWDSLHFVRTLLSFGATVSTLYAGLRKP